MNTNFTTTASGDYTDVGQQSACAIFSQLGLEESSENPASDTFFFQAVAWNGPYYGLSFTDVLLSGTQTTAYTAQAGQIFYYEFDNGNLYAGNIYEGNFDPVAMQAAARYVDTEGDFATCFTPGTLISTPHRQYPSLRSCDWWSDPQSRGAISACEMGWYSTHSSPL